MLLKVRKGVARKKVPALKINIKRTLEKKEKKITITQIPRKKMQGSSSNLLARIEKNYRWRVTIQMDKVATKVHQKSLRVVL
jgi:hypothetical protein